MIPTPTLGPRYWIVLCFASVLGANLGDFLSRELGLGYWRGLPVLAVLFGGAAVMARFVPRSLIWYWLAIVVVRAAATNLSDLQILTPGEPPTVRSVFSFPVVIVAWSVALAFCAAQDRDHAKGEAQTRASFWFWTSMLAAGTVGTATGDWLAFQSGIGLPVAALVSTVMLVAAYVALSRPAAQKVFAFWILVVFVRNWGTNAGDFLSDTIGLLQSTAISAALTVLLGVLWYRGALRDRN